MRKTTSLRTITSGPRLALEPEARLALTRGFNKLAATLTVTLGPRGRLVAVSRDNPRRAPELINDGATIARRFLGLPDRFETMGAFLARHIAWQVEEAVGDGATTAVVVAQAVINQAMRYTSAGYNPMLLRRSIDRALGVALRALTRQARPLEGTAHIRALATAVTGDPRLGELVEEIFDTVGALGAVQVRTNYGREHTSRYINGAFWNQGWASSYFTTEGGTAIIKEPYILLTNRQLDRATQLAPILEQVHPTGRGLVVIAPAITGEALNILVTNKTRGIVPTLAVKAPGLGPEKTEILQDLAAMTGARVFLANHPDRLETATLADLGEAREVQAIRSGFTLIGGRGRPAAIRQRSAELRARIPDAPYGRERDRLVERAGKLLGGVALLEVGGSTETEREYLKDRASEAVEVARMALQHGVVPGGGAAYLACIPALTEFAGSEDAEGAAILAHALAAPMTALVENAGFEASPILARVRACGDGCGFDVLRGEFVDLAQAGIVDPVKVLEVALRTGVSGALMALTTEVLVHKPRPNRSKEVDFRP